jgi:diguanylate cyclase (GGDEF)-like protein
VKIRLQSGIALLSVLIPFAAAIAVANSGSDARPWSLDGQMVFVRMASLETSAVTAIAQDPQGFLWFGTQSNLLRWDGYQLRTYARNPDAAGSLPDNFIRSLLVDDRGQLWVGTNSGGLSRYDPQIDGFVSFPVGPKGTSDGTISVLISDHHSGLWIGTGHGIDHMNGTTGRIDPPDANLPRDTIAALLLDRAGALWAGTRKGLLRRTRVDSKFLPYPLPAPEGPAPVIRALHEDQAGRIWIGVDLNGAFILEPGADTVRRLLEAPGSGRPLVDNISAICEVDKSEVWLGTAESGIVRVDTTTWKVMREQRDLTRSRGLPSNQIDSLFVDRGGTMWVGTRSVLSNVNPRQHLIQTFFGGSAPGLLIRGDTVSSILALPDGRVWMALVGGGIEIVDPIAGPIGMILPEPDHPDSALPNVQVITMARWEDGDIFLGTAAGLYRASPDGRSLKRLQVPAQSETVDVRALLVANGHLWLGGLDGLSELEVLPGGVLGLKRRWDQELGDPRVRTVVNGRDAGIWIGTASGVAHLDPANGKVTHLSNDPRNPSLLPGGYVSSMLTDRKGRLWVATFGRGIQVEQRRDAGGRPIFRRLTQSDGLPQNSVDALLEDVDGNIWASTDGGLARIEPDSLSIRAFRTEQGVGIDGFFTGDADTTPAGDLLFGGLNGLIVVHPERLTPAAGAPPIVVTDVRVGARSLASSQSLLSSGLTVGSQDRSFAIEFAALDFTDPEQRHYAYRLQGFDKDWLETPTSRRVASYTNLPPRDYILQLRSAGAGNEWSTPLDIAVHVQPAWYEYGAARALAAIIALLLIVGLVQVRTTLVLRRQRELESIVAERTAQLQRNQEYLERMAYIDVLTELPNRRVFNDDLRRFISGCERGQGDFALLLIDLDGFKSINDTVGHDAGDAVLVEVAVRLRTLIRETDLVARLGGDEFGLVLAQPRNMSAVDSTCARIIKNLNEPITLADRVVVIGASIGVAKAAGGHTTPDEIYKAADMALYEAKKAGRNTWRWDETSAASAALTASWKRSDMNERVEQPSDARENDRPKSRFHTG